MVTFPHCSPLLRKIATVYSVHALKTPFSSDLKKVNIHLRSRCCTAQSYLLVCKKRHMKKSGQPKNIFFDRDLSWLSFNARVLAEAQRKTVPLMERLKFLSICSANMDEFYRVRMPAILALGRLETDENVKQSGKLKRINSAINRQLNQFGKTLLRNILPGL